MISKLAERPDGAELTCDIAVIGAGAAGIALARQFAGRSERVIVLEAGGDDFDQAYQDTAGYRTEGRGIFVGVRLADPRSLR